MPGPVCRLSIQHGPDSVDLALPSDTLIGALLPSIVDLVHRGPVAAVEGRQWYLSRVGQEQLDEATSLCDNVTIALDLTRKKPVAWMIGSTPVGSAADRARASG